jgi:hypothetical protein
MDDRIASLEKALQTLETAVHKLDRRITNLEGGSAAGSPIAERVDDVAADQISQKDREKALAAVIGTPALVGRSLLVLAGAFLLRALTEGGTLETATGVTLGVAYAAVWVVAAARAAARGSQTSAGFHSVCSALIAYPLLFEASTAFGVLSSTAAAVAVAGTTAAGLVVASRSQMRAAAWVFGMGGLIAASALAVARPPGEAATAVLVALGFASLWLADAHGWGVLRWFTAIAADIGVLRLTEMATAPSGLPDGFGEVHLPVVVLLQAVLVVGFVGTSVARAVRGKSRLNAFDVVQSAAAWAVGWGGAVHLAKAHDLSTTGLFLLALACGVAAYAAAFGVVDRRQGKNRAFFFLSSAGLVLVLVGLPGVVGTASAPVWSLLAVGVAAVGSRWDRVTLRVHSAVLLLVAWMAQGLLIAAVKKLVGRGEAVATPEVETVIVVLMTIITAAVVMVGRRLRTTGWAQRLPLTGLLGMSAIGFAAISVWLAVAFAPAAAIAVGTVTLAAVTVGYALLASRWGVIEAGWLVYPLLVLTGLQVVFHDLASGSTLALVFTLAAYGVALIISPRLVRSGRD